MIPTGKCFKCEKVIPHVNIESININQSFVHAYNGISYVCPYCQTILGVGMDPIALKADTVNAVVSSLKK